VSARQGLKAFSEEMIEAQLHACIESAATAPEDRRELRSLLAMLKRYAV
jgi:DNA-binding FrmR family transcriptional regulator